MLERTCDGGFTGCGKTGEPNCKAGRFEDLRTIGVGKVC